MGMPIHQLNLQQFIDWENAQTGRNEYVGGKVFEMGDRHRVHGCVVGNLIRLLGNDLDGSACQVFAHSMKVQIADDTILYPDVFVTCDPADLTTEIIFHAPKLVIEVLSPSTQAYDRSQKFALYRRLPSLLEYVLIDPDTRRIETFRRGADELWVLHDMSERAQLDIACLDARVPLGDVFAGLDVA